VKLTQEDLAYIQSVVSTADSLKIDSLIIEPNMVRGIDEHQTTFLIQTRNVPELSCGSIGLNRLSIFTSRLNTIKSINDFEVAVTMPPEVEGVAPFARSLTFKGPGIKIDYRCGNPSLMRAPRKINEPLAYQIEMSASAITLIQKGQAAMAADNVYLIGNDEGVMCQMEDINSDVFSFKLAEKIHRLDEDDGNPVNFNHKYPIKRLLALFKNNTDVNFYLTPRGILKTTLNNLEVYTLRDEEDDD